MKDELKIHQSGARLEARQAPRLFIPAPLTCPTTEMVSQAQSSLVKVDAQKISWKTASPLHFLPLSGRSTCPATGPVKVNQSWSKLIQHKIGKMFRRAKIGPEKKSRENSRKIAKIKPIKVNKAKNFFARCLLAILSHRLSAIGYRLSSLIAALPPCALLLSIQPTSAQESPHAIVPAIPESRTVDTNVMQQIYGEVKTPFKYGVVLSGATNELVDCPSIFRNGEHWYMLYVAISNKVGYQTFFARSDDLLHWQKLGKILSFTKTNQWDAWQADGGIALADYRWDGAQEMEKFDGKYWLSYIGGARRGYETDPLSIGIAWTKNPTRTHEWNRLAENPVLSPKQPDARSFETKTLYKSQIIHDQTQSLGWPFIMYYNAKYKNGFEQIGMAVSSNLKNWSRYGTNSVIVNGAEKKNGISGDPQIVKMGDVWVMFYFGAGWQPRAFDTFACSYDLVHWTKWTGPHLVEPSEPFDQIYAHKPWVLKWNGVVYHFYCAVGNQGRVLALATSKDLKTQASR